MIPYLLAIAGGYLIGQSSKSKLVDEAAVSSVPDAGVEVAAAMSDGGIVAMVRNKKTGEISRWIVNSISEIDKRVYQIIGVIQDNTKRIDNRMKALYELRKYMGTPVHTTPDSQEELQVITENDKELVAEIRYWGEWEHADNSRNIEDDDFMVLSRGSEKRLNDIISIIQKRYPVTIFWQTGEKNWLEIQIINNIN